MSEGTKGISEMMVEADEYWAAGHEAARVEHSMLIVLWKLGLYKGTTNKLIEHMWWREGY